MKSLLVIAAVAIAFGVVALQCAAAGDADENWTPVHLPFPPPGRVVLGQFHLSSGGIFEIQVLTTAQEIESRRTRRRPGSDGNGDGAPRVQGNEDSSPDAR
jgi:hypothetical protein